MKILIINLSCFLILVVIPFFRDIKQKKKTNVKLQKIQNDLECINKKFKTEEDLLSKINKLEENKEELEKSKEQLNKRIINQNKHEELLSELEKVGMELLDKTFEYSLKSFKENIKKGKSTLYIEPDQFGVPPEVTNFFSTSKTNKDGQF